MKQICFLTGLYGRRDALIVERQGRSLAADGYDVTYVVCDKNGDEQIYGIKITSCGFTPRNRVERMMSTAKHLYRKAIEINADIYQISEPELIGLGVKLKKLGKRVIFNMRENYISNVMEKSYIPKPLRGVVSRLTEIIFRKKLPLYDAVFSVTDEISDTFSAMGIECRTVRNFPMIDPAHSITEADYLARENRLLYYGTVYRVSCQHKIFDALEHLDNITYHIAGPCESDITNHSYWSRVDYQGRFTKAEMEVFLSRATISNILRDFTAIGIPNGSYGVLKMFESMEAGLPIICSDVKINREIVAQYNCGICVDIHDTEAIRKAVQSLTLDREAAYQMGQNGRRAVIERFNWDNEYTTYKSIIESLMGLSITKLPKFSDARGSLSFVENLSSLPFEISNISCIFEKGNQASAITKTDSEEHFIIALSGSCRVVMNGADGDDAISLEQPSQGLHIPKGVSNYSCELSKGATAIVLSSHSKAEIR